MKSDNEAVQKIKVVAAEQEVTLIVIGNPLEKTGAEGSKTKKVRSFAEKLRHEVNAPITFWDERLSSVTAQKLLIETESKKKRRNKEKIDELAAVVILRHYMDSNTSKISG